MTKKNKLNRRWLTEGKFNFTSPVGEFFTQLFQEGIEGVFDLTGFNNILKQKLKNITKDFEEWGGGTDLTIEEVAEYFDDNYKEYEKLTHYIAMSVLDWFEENIEDVMSYAVYIADDAIGDYDSSFDADKLHFKENSRGAGIRDYDKNN